MSNKDLQPYFRLYSQEKRLTVQEEEAIIDAVVAKNVEKRRRAEGRGGYSVFRVALVGTALLLLFSLAIVWLPHSNSGDTFTERGETRALFVPQCIGEKEAHRCKIGETLVFRVNAPPTQPYLAAFAVHDDTGKVYWYYPIDETGVGIAVHRESKQGVLTQGIRIGAEHRPGRYTVYGVFSENAMRRADIRTTFEAGKPKSTTAVSVVEAKLEIW